MNLKLYLLKSYNFFLIWFKKCSSSCCRGSFSTWRYRDKQQKSSVYGYYWSSISSRGGSAIQICIDFFNDSNFSWKCLSFSKKTNDGWTKWIVLRNKKLSFFKHGRMNTNNLKLFEHTWKNDSFFFTERTNFPKDF